ncbi:MAG: 3-isopropylmalate dehydratase small subunit [Candidatus Kerfeldbacteria bacterium]|nr:3-isopropylmalate dehydratase small subunit [Candidatus Kerfeldbacteria bacterium]
MKKFETIISIVTPILIDNIDTDQIIPAEFLKVINKKNLGAHLFANWRQDPNFVFNQLKYQASQILVVGKNFGCGSSREHAPWALLDYGFKVIIALSFADIFKNNSFHNGLLPITVPDHIQQKLMNQMVTVNLEEQTISWNRQHYSFDISSFNKKRLLHGVDDIGYTLQFNDLISCYEQTHPGVAR